jgi:hypothetical protein
MATRDFDQWVKIHALPEQMNRKDGCRSRRNCRFDAVDIHQIIVIPDIYENRPSTQRPDRGHCRHRGIGYRDDFVPGFHAQCGKRNANGVGSAVDADAPERADIVAHLAFELTAFLSQHQPSGAEYAIYRCQNFVAQLIILSRVVPDINGLISHSHSRRDFCADLPGDGDLSESYGEGSVSQPLLKDKAFSTL